MSIKLVKSRTHIVKAYNCKAQSIIYFIYKYADCCTDHISDSISLSEVLHRSFSYLFSLSAFRYEIGRDNL